MTRPFLQLHTKTKTIQASLKTPWKRNEPKKESEICHVKGTCRRLNLIEKQVNRKTVGDGWLLTFDHIGFSVAAGPF